MNCLSFPSTTLNGQAPGEIKHVAYQLRRVAIVVGDKWRDNILKVNIISDRLITAKLLIDTININIVSAYAPQVGCTDEEKEEFWEEF